ncbi:MAG: Ig-like domain-containing protein [Chloroflexi bacterium]|nr:Ig-like domain-containing protein [Chloroflexota bacterium]
MRRLISLVSVTVALVGLGFVLVNATTVDRRPPSVKSISLSAPAGDPQVAQVLSAIDIEFSEPVRTATAESRFRIDPDVDGTFSWNGSTAIFTPSRKLPQDTTFTISIASGVEDLAGNVDPVGLDVWTFATVGPPFVLRATPSDGASGVPLDGTIELVFDRLMDTTSVERAISLAPSANVTAAWSGSVVTLSLGPGLVPGTVYTLTVASAAADTGGSRLRAPYRQTFTTVGSGLNVTAVIPADGVAGIGVASPIAIRFDGPIDPSTAQSAIHVTPSVDGEVRVVALDGDGASLSNPVPPGGGDMVVLIPSAPLAPHTTYTVTLDPTVARVGDPKAVTIGRTWSFTTGAPTQSGQNQIAFLGARGGVRNVWIMNPDGTNQRELTVELLPVSSYDATADGARIVYAAGGIVSTMAIDGSGLKRLTADDGRLEYAPALVPGDQWVVVARRSASGDDLGYWLLPMPGTSGSERQLLARGAPPPDSVSLRGDGVDQTDSTPAWAPRIAFEPTGRTALLVTARGDVQVIDIRQPDLLEGGLSAPTQVSIVGDAAPVWVPARNAFVLAAAPASGGDRTLFAVGTRGRAEVLAGTMGAAGPVAISATGALAYVVRGADGRATVQVMARDGTITAIESLAGRDDRWPAFAPDSRTLLVGRSLVAEPNLSDGIWAVDLPTGQARRLTVDGARARWVP